MDSLPLAAAFSARGRMGLGCVARGTCSTTIAGSALPAPAPTLERQGQGTVANPNDGQGQRLSEGAGGHGSFGRSASWVILRREAEDIGRGKVSGDGYCGQRGPEVSGGDGVDLIAERFDEEQQVAAGPGDATEVGGGDFHHDFRPISVESFPGALEAEISALECPF